MNWTTDEPRPKHVCVKLSVENHDRGWITDDCFNPNHVICQNCKLCCLEKNYFSILNIMIHMASVLFSVGQGILEKISPTKQSARYIIYQQGIELLVIKI